MTKHFMGMEPQTSMNHDFSKPQFLEGVFLAIGKHHRISACVWGPMGHEPYVLGISKSGQIFGRHPFYGNLEGENDDCDMLGYGQHGPRFHTGATSGSGGT